MPRGIPRLAVPVAVLCAVFFLGVQLPTSSPSVLVGELSPAPAGHSSGHARRILTETGCVPAAAGLFCGGGHTNLRAPWVPYPTVPTVAPDGLNYGPVGLVGVHGPVGASSFSKGSATIFGITPSAVTGTNTVISANTFWGNETLSLVGNVTVSAGFRLTVWNSVLTFTEPASSVHFAYGFNVSSGGASSLYIEHGSNVTQSSAATNSWFVYTPGLGYRVDVENSTLNVPSAHVPLFGAVAAFSFVSETWTPSTTFSRGIFVSEFNDSTYDGYGNDEYNNSLNVTDHAQHSLIENGWYIGPDSGNDSFLRATVGISSGLIDQQGADAHQGTFSLNDSTLQDLTSPSFLYVPTAPGLGIHSVRGTPWYGAGRLYIVGTLIENWTLWSGLGSKLGELTSQSDSLGVPPGIFGGNYTGERMVVENSTIENVLFATTGDDDLLGVITSGPILNADGNTIVIEHDLVTNVTDAQATAKNPLVFYGTVSRSENVEFDAFEGFSATKIPNSDFEVVEIHALNYNFSYNLFERWGTAQAPAASAAFYWIDNSQALYNSVVGEPSLTHLFYPTQCVQTYPYECLPAGPYNLTRHDWNMIGNFAVNVTGQSWIAQVLGVGGAIRNNTQVNVTEGTGIGISVASGSADSTVTGNTCYGVYNLSYCVGSNQGGSISAVYSGNVAYDVDNTSYALWSAASNDTFTSESGQSLLIFNDNNTTDPNKDYGFWYPSFSKVAFDNSNFSAIGLLGQVSNLADNRTRAPWPNDFFLTEDNSFLPSPFLAQVCTLESGKTNVNHYVLNLTGYLGVTADQWSCLETDTVRSESQLAVWDYGEITPAVTIPTNGANHQVWVDPEGPLETAVSVDSDTAPPLTISFDQDHPYATYVVTESATVGGVVLSSEPVTADSTGNVQLTFAPSAGFLNVTFEAACSVPCSGSAPAGAGLFALSFGGIPVEVWAGAALLGVAALVGLEEGRRRQ
jgi:hypothetical protein